MAQKFMSKENMQMILGIFVNYMEETQHIRFNTDDIGHLKKTVFTVMTNTQPRGRNLHEMNLEVLSIIKEQYKRAHRSLERDQTIFGDRKVVYNEAMPQASSTKKPDLDQLVSEREELTQKPTPDISKLGRQVIETPQPADDFMRRLKELENVRENMQVPQGGTLPVRPQELSLADRIVNLEISLKQHIKDVEKRLNELENLRLVSS